MLQFIHLISPYHSINMSVFRGTLHIFKTCCGGQMLKSHKISTFLILSTMMTVLLDNHVGTEIFQYSKREF